MTRCLCGIGLLLAAWLLLAGCSESKTGGLPAAPPREAVPPAAKAAPPAEPAIPAQASGETSEPPRGPEPEEPAAAATPGQSRVLGAIGRAVRGAIGKPAKEMPAEAPKYKPPK